MVAETRKGITNGERKEEGSKGIVLSNARGGSDVLAVVVANESDGSDVVVRVEIYGSNDQKLAEKDLIASEAVDS
jgi:hypothetical protein